MFNYNESNLSVKWTTELENSDFCDDLMSRWKYIHDETYVFKYKLGNILERIVGNNKYLLQLNPDRGNKRRFPEEIGNLQQAFDSKKFNFNKVSKNEVLMQIIEGSNDNNIHKILVNVSPISKYHSLLCPFIEKCLPQVISSESLKLTLQIMFLCKNRDLRIGFNSLCALASVNHLHFHLLFEKRILPIEEVKCVNLKGPLYCTATYPVPAFCMQLKSKDEINQRSEDTYKLFKYLLDRNIAHNMMITRGENLVLEHDEVIRIIVWPRKSSYGVKQLTAFNVAVCELSGWFPVYSNNDFENLKTDAIESELRKWKLDNFDELCEDIKSIF